MMIPLKIREHHLQNQTEFNLCLTSFLKQKTRKWSGEIERFSLKRWSRIQILGLEIPDDQARQSERRNKHACSFFLHIPCPPYPSWRRIRRVRRVNRKTPLLRVRKQKAVAEEMLNIYSGNNYYQTTR